LQIVLLNARATNTLGWNIILNVSVEMNCKLEVSKLPILIATILARVMQMRTVVEHGA
jgi:hypothetical protein